VIPGGLLGYKGIEYGYPVQEQDLLHVDYTADSTWQIVS
jgi:hypothetical protein